MRFHLLCQSVARQILVSCMTYRVAADGMRLLFCFLSCLYLSGWPGNRARTFICTTDKCACATGAEGGLCYG